jgi:hypothetical protein
MVENKALFMENHTIIVVIGIVETRVSYTIALLSNMA